jgi:hypothetical protein
MARKVLPYPTEEQAAALYKPRKVRSRTVALRRNFSLGCMLAGLLTDTFLL